MLRDTIREKRCSMLLYFQVSARYITKSIGSFRWYTEVLLDLDMVLISTRRLIKNIKKNCSGTLKMVMNLIQKKIRKMIHRTRRVVCVPLLIKQGVNGISLPSLWGACTSFKSLMHT